MRGISVFVGFVAVIVCAAPATVFTERDVHRSADVDWTPVLVTLPVAVAGFLICRALRAAASRRYVAASIRRGRAGGSPAFAFTLLAWLLAAPAGGLAFATFLVYQTSDDPTPGKYREGLAQYPLPALFLFAGLAVLGAAGYYAWTFRRRHEIPPLVAAGVAVLVEPPRRLPKAQAVKLRTLMWLRGTVIEALFFAGVLVPQLLDGDRPSGDDLESGVFMVLGGPAVISFALLVVMLLFWPTRRSAFDALRQPSSLAAIGLVLVGLALDSAGQAVAGAIVGPAGLLIAAATCLNIMDRGAQPWLGFVYLAASYLFGYLRAPDGSTVLPTGVAGWVVAVLAAAYAVREARSHWREWTTLAHPADVATPAT
jgi:hypothetical protein